jgi:hypothetical protein
VNFLRALLSLGLLFALLFSCASEAPAPPPPKPPDEAAALKALQELNRAQADFIRRTRRYAQRTDELIADHLLTAAPSAEGYTLDMRPSADAVRYTLQATPNAPDARHFFTDQTGVIRSEIGKPASAESPQN